MNIIETCEIINETYTQCETDITAEVLVLGLVMLFIFFYFMVILFYLKKIYKKI